MRKRVLTILTVMIMAAALAACGTGENAAQAADDASAYDESDDSIPFDEQDDSWDIPAAGAYSGRTVVSLPKELAAAVCEYLSESAGEEIGQQELVIPGYVAVGADNTDPEDVRVLGDFWYISYELQEDVLVSTGGREYSGCLHFRQEDGKYIYKSRELVAAESEEHSPEKVFGNNLAAWKSLRSDYAGKENVRAQLIADYAAAFGFSAASYQDFGWDPQDLPDPALEQDNIFFYILRRGETNPIPEMVVSPASEEPSAEEPQEEEPEVDAYVVKQGDSLGKIAREHGISTEELAEMNRDTILRAARSQGVKSEDLMKCANYIFPGEILAVPKK